MAETHIPIHITLLDHILMGIEGACPNGPSEEWALGAAGKAAHSEGNLYIPCTRSEARNIFENMRQTWDFQNLGEHELNLLAHIILRAEIK